VYKSQHTRWIGESAAALLQQVAGPRFNDDIFRIGYEVCGIGLFGIGMGAIRVCMKACTKMETGLA